MKNYKYKIQKLISDPLIIINLLASKGLLNWLPDKTYLKLLFYVRMKRRLNLNNPKTFNEKLQWLKLYDRNPIYTSMVDKYEVRNYIKEKVGDEYLIPLIGVWDSFDEINFEKLPNQFVLKCTHDSGGVVICRNKNEFDVESARKKINKSLKKNFYNNTKEWPYKNIKPRIICEKFMVDESGVELKDYKFFCFNGEPKALFVATDRGKDTRFDFFDMNFNKIPITKNHYKNSNKKISKPIGFEKMIELSKKLSSGIPHVRVDFYNVNGQIYFGELTFYHFSGFEKFEPEKYDEIFGSWLKLPKD